MNSVISERYALSIFELSEEDSISDSTLNDLKLVYDLFKEELDFIKVLSSPFVTIEEKFSIVKNVFSNNVHIYIENLIMLLCEKRRINCFFGIFLHYKELYYNKYNIKEATIVSAVELSDDQKDRIVAKLEKDNGKKILANYVIDSSIIAGIVVKIDNKQMDYSISSRLDELRKSLSEIIA